MANTYPLSKKELRDLARVISGTLLTQSEICMLDGTELTEEDQRYVLERVHKFGEAIHKKVIDTDYLRLALNVDVMAEHAINKEYEG